MNTQTRPAGSPARIHADHRALKQLGNWTTSRNFEIRSRRGRVVIDLRSPRIPAGDIRIDLDLDRSAVTLLVAEDAVIDQWDLAWTGGGKVKQTFHHPAASSGRRILLTGHIRHGEIRVHSGGIAQLSAICSREFFADARQAHADGRLPTLDDPARGA
jgi:hypothetical protein